MGKDYSLRTHCRLCDSPALTSAFSLAPTPLANAFVRREQLSQPQDLYPLTVCFCNACAHVQLREVVDPIALYKHYLYVSGTSPVFVKHFRDYSGHVIDAFAPEQGSFVIDIGSNDGTLLRFFRESGYRILGIDPAVEIGGDASAHGIPTIPEFFSAAVAESVKARHGRAAVVTSNNLLAHIDDLKDFMIGVRELLTERGIFVFEVSYLADVIEKNLFDIIYHEHLDYHSAAPLERFFTGCGLELIEVERVNTHGGSLRGVVQLKGGPRRAGDSVSHLIAEERARHLDKLATLASFSKRIDGFRAEFLNLLRELRAGGKRIAGFGAPAKLTTLMYQLGFAHDALEFVVDDSPLKQGCYTPGMHIPILPASSLYEKRPDYAVILAWNFAESIIANHASFREGGGRFIVPMPALRIV